MTFKKMVLKTLAVTTVVGAVMAMSSVVANATITSNDTNILTGDSAPQNDAAVAGDGFVTYTYEIGGKSGAQTFFGLQMGEIQDSTGKFNSNTAHITFTTNGRFDITVEPTSGHKNSQLTITNSGSVSNADVDLIDPNAQSDAPVTKQGLKAGTWILGRTGSNAYVGKLIIKVYKPDPTYPVSGTITYSGCSVNDVNILIDGDPISVSGSEASGTYSTNLTTGSHDVTVDNPTIYTIEPETFEVAEAEKTQDFTVTKKAVTELTITPAAELGLKDDTINLKDAEGNIVQATKSDTNYKATVAQGGSYTIDVLGDSGYKESEYYVTGYEVTIGSEATQTVPLGAEKLTVWDFVSNTGKTLPGDVKFEGNSSSVSASGKYKGLQVDASGSFTTDKQRYGKFDTSTVSAQGGVQVNSQTKITVPCTPATQTVIVTLKDTNGIGYSIEYGDANATITIGGPTTNDSSGKYSTYIEKIEIKDSKKLSEVATPVDGAGEDVDLSYTMDTTNKITYVIFGLEDADLANDKLTVKVGTGADGTESRTETVTDVFKTIQFADQDSIVAGEGSYAKYAALYAIKVSGVTKAPTKNNVVAKLSKDPA